MIGGADAFASRITKSLDLSLSDGHEQSGAWSRVGRAIRRMKQCQSDASNSMSRIHHSGIGMGSIIDQSLIPFRCDDVWRADIICLIYLFTDRFRLLNRKLLCVYLL